MHCNGVLLEMLALFLLSSVPQDWDPHLFLPRDPAGLQNWLLLYSFDLKVHLYFFFLKISIFLLCTVEKFKFLEFLLDDKNATYLSS